jgi:ribosomal RNA-processing protein 12
VWAADDKNRFRMKIRILVERMLRRCGEDAVKEALPEGHERLLAHIRKAKAKARKKHDDARSVKSGDGKKAASAAGTARTARRSEWRESILGA